MWKLSVFLLFVTVTATCLQVNCQKSPDDETEEGIQPRTFLLAALAAKTAGVAALGASGLAASFLRPGAFAPPGFFPFNPNGGFIPLPAPMPAPIPSPEAPRQVIDLPVVVDELGNFYYQQMMPDGQTQYVFLPPEFIARMARERALQEKKLEETGLPVNDTKSAKPVTASVPLLTQAQKPTLLSTSAPKTPSLAISNSLTMPRPTPLLAYPAKTEPALTLKSPLKRRPTLLSTSAAKSNSPTPKLNNYIDEPYNLTSSRLLSASALSEEADISNSEEEKDISVTIAKL